MQRRFLTLVFSLFVFAALLALNASAGQTEREAALFIRSALDTSTPYSYWFAVEAKTPTIFFYVQHRVWHDGSPIMRHEGKKLLSCVASMLSALQHESVKPIGSHRYRILINPLPPGGGTQLAAEGPARQQLCLKGHEQELILHLLFAKTMPYTF